MGRTLEEIIPENQNAPFDMYEAIDALIDEGSFFDVKKLFAQEIITGLGYELKDNRLELLRISRK